MSVVAQDIREMITEQLRFKELLFQMIRRDLLIRYKQSVMGFGWAVFMPLLNTIIFSVVFMRVARLDVGMPYPLYAFSGLLFWNLSAGAWKFATNALTTNANLVTKVYFPREIFPFSAVIVATIDSAVGAILLAAFMVYYRVPLTPAILFLPVVLLVQISFTTGVALILSMANLFYRDVKYLFEVAVTAWMFGTTVLYPLKDVGSWTGWVFALNPMSPIIDAYRDVLLKGTLPPAVPFGIVAIVSLVTLIGGWLSFHRSEFRFAESI